jgi:hypothetical protein
MAFFGSGDRSQVLPPAHVVLAAAGHPTNIAAPEDALRPGIVEAHARDANGREWVFVDNSSIFSAEALTSATEYPVEGIIGCNVILEGSSVSRVTTVWTDGLRADDGPFDELQSGVESQFDVLTADLADPDGGGEPAK